MSNDPQPTPAPATLFPSRPDRDHALLRVAVDSRGIPIGATGAMLLPAPPERVWGLVRDIAHYKDYVPMIDESRRDGDHVSVGLRFKVALFSARFAFTARVVEEPGRVLELRYLTGEPRDIHIRFELEPQSDGKETQLTVAVRFDMQSLGWLVKYFLRHHPEIQFGVLSGSALTLLQAVRSAL